MPIKNTFDAIKFIQSQEFDVWVNLPINEDELWLVWQVIESCGDYFTIVIHNTESKFKKLTGAKREVITSIKVLEKNIDKWNR